MDVSTWTQASGLERRDEQGTTGTIEPPPLEENGEADLTRRRPVHDGLVTLNNLGLDPFDWFDRRRQSIDH